MSLVHKPRTTKRVDYVYRALFTTSGSADIGHCPLWLRAFIGHCSLLETAISWTLPTILSWEYTGLFGTHRISDTLFSPILGVCLILGLLLTLPSGCLWAYSGHCPIAELGGTLSKVLLSVCAMQRNAATCFGFCFSRRHMGNEVGTVQLVQWLD